MKILIKVTIDHNNEKVEQTFSNREELIKNLSKETDDIYIKVDEKKLIEEIAKRYSYMIKNKILNKLNN